MHDVMIVGAGPVGLFLAGELRLAGASVLMVERDPQWDSPLKRAPFGIRGLSVATCEALDRRGLLDAVLDADTEGVPRRDTQPGHFAGIPFDRDDIDESGWAYRSPGPAGMGMAAVTMAGLEGVLAQRAAELGVRLVRGVAVEQIAQSPEGVTATGAGRTFSARWLVGCDGGRSIVRKLGGFPFVETHPTFTGYSVLAQLGAGTTLPLGRHHTAAGMFVQPSSGTFSLADFDGGASHRATDLTAEHVQAVMRRVTGRDVTVERLDSVATWTDRARQVTVYRQGRLLLAGDAAHVHSPLGGQGLNLGLGDAINLGWKLGAVCSGTAPPGLLETYSAERHPVGAAVLDWSRAQVALISPGSASRALAAIVGDLIATRDGATYFARRMWGIDTRYHLDDATHPLIGCSAPDFMLADGRRLGVALRDGSGVLLDCVGHHGLRSIVESSDRRIVWARGAGGQFGLGAVVIRPDGIVAWACDAGSDRGAAVEGARRAVARWMPGAEPGTL
jgi:2-polyprenyl-6-methoxyphenol hydroxylase-like FAD-dependent oxidoreductase